MTRRTGLALKRIGALFAKESLQIVRDPSSLMIAVALPMILLFLCGYGISFDLRKTPVCIVAEGRDAPTAALLASFQASKEFDVEVAKATADCLPRLISTAVKAVLVIPADFADRLAGSDDAPVQLLLDGSDPNTAGLIALHAQGAWNGWLAYQSALEGALFRQPIDIVPRTWFNPLKLSRFFILPGLVAVIMTLIGTMLTSLVVAREWERGTMEAMMATPIGLPALLLGKVAPYYVLGMLAMAVTTLVTTLLFGVPFVGSPLLLAATTSVFLLCTLGQGLLISTLAKNQFVATQGAMMSAFLPAFMLSGMVFEISSMPLPIRLVTYLVPARYFVPILETLFLTGNVPAVLIPNVLAMLAIAALLFALVIARTPRRLDG